jgi:Bacterial Ig-like domain (group 3)/Autotransporter beta-domain/IPT/TIG domain
VLVTATGGTNAANSLYTYVAPPTVSAISPSSGPTAGGTSVTITGTGFTGATGVTIGGTAATSVTVVSSTSITAVTPVHSVGTASVLVTTTGGTNSANTLFTYVAGPTIGTIAPSGGPIAGGTSVIITGSSLSGATAVTFGGVAATAFTVNSATQITATTPAHAAGAVDVVVTTPGGNATSTGGYTYAAPPTIGTVTPSSGPNSGGTSVTISGSSFTGATVVTFGGVAATSFTVNSATQITATTPTHAIGAVDVVVTAPGGGVTGSGAYTYVTVLTLTSTPSATTQLGQTYSQTNVAAGGTAPYTYSISAGAIPAGTTFSSVTGLVAGTTTTAGGFSYTVKVTDSSATPQTTTQSVSGSVTTGVTTTSISSSLNPSQVGQAVTFTATVTGSGATPTGTVSFRDGGVSIGTATLAAGAATFSIAALTLGSHTITASYAGNGTFSASTSPGLVEVVNTPADSLKLRAMQVLATTVVAQNSGQAISGAVDAAIADGFNDGGNFVAPAGGGLHFNFTSDPEEQPAANPASRTSDRWNGTVRSDGSNGLGLVGQTMGPAAINGPARGQAPSRIDDAFASIDRAAIATKARARMVEPKEWMLWADVSASGINRWNSAGNTVTSTGFTVAPLYGSQVNALIGLTRKFNGSFLVGAFGGYETFDYRSDALAGRLKGEGWTIGSYLGWKLTPNIRFTAAAAYSGITYDGSAGTATGNFDGNRWLLSTGLVGSYQLQRLQIEPSATVYALWEHENAYTDSLGTLQDDRTFFTGRASGGGRLIYPLEWTSTVTLAPYLGLYGDYYFNSDDAAVVALAGAAPLASTPILDGWSARATGGIAARFHGGGTIAFGAELGGIGASAQIWTFRGRGSVPF